MSTPADYSMCCQTVTVYRQNVQGVDRQVIPNCFLQWKESLHCDHLGAQLQRDFLLIQPGEKQLVFPGDRVLEGIGPEITNEEWMKFVPETVAGLGIVAYAQAFYWLGEYCHTEAGRKQGSK